MFQAAVAHIQANLLKISPFPMHPIDNHPQGHSTALVMDVADVAHTQMHLLPYILLSPNYPTQTPQPTPPPWTNDIMLQMLFNN